MDVAPWSWTGRGLEQLPRRTVLTGAWLTSTGEPVLLSPRWELSLAVGHAQWVRAAGTEDSEAAAPEREAARVEGKSGCRDEVRRASPRLAGSAGPDAVLGRASPWVSKREHQGPESPRPLQVALMMSSHISVKFAKAGCFDHSALSLQFVPIPTVLLDFSPF